MHTTYEVIRDLNWSHRHQRPHSHAHHTRARAHRAVHMRRAVTGAEARALPRTLQIKTPDPGSLESAAKARCSGSSKREPRGSSFLKAILNECLAATHCLPRVVCPSAERPAFQDLPPDLEVRPAPERQRGGSRRVGSSALRTLPSKGVTEFPGGTKKVSQG